MDSYRNVNSYPDALPQNFPMYIKDNKINEEIISNILDTKGKLMNTLESHFDNFKANADYTVYTGFGGIIYLYFSEFLKSRDKVFLSKALELLEIGFSKLKYKSISFLLGDAGLLALGAVLHKLNDNPKVADEYIDRLVHLNLDGAKHPDEVLYGRAGYLYCLLFVDKYHSPVIPMDVYRKVITSILSTGKMISTFLDKPYPLYYSWRTENYFGAAHGVAGILYLLLCANEMLSDDERNELIKPTIDWLRDQNLRTGNFNASEESTHDRLVQWCHGAPGFVHLFLQAWKVYKDKQYLMDAMRLGDVVWERGLLTKGYSICHGVSGNAYTFLALYKATREEKHLYRAACFADWCTHHPRNEEMRPDRPYSLFEGIAGLAHFLSDMQDPLNSTFPGYEI